MPATQPTAAASSRQDPFRWSRAEIATVLENFADPDPPSQREAAHRFGIPHATFNYWTRHYSPTAGDPMDSFFRSRCGEAVLRRIVLAALCTFQFQGACGIRQVGTFLDRAGLLCRFSRGACIPRGSPEADPVAFRDGQKLPWLTDEAHDHYVDPDEHGHGKPRLVAIERCPTSLPWSYRDHRDADTRKGHGEGIAGMPVEVI
jgi:hypothetical protein